MISNAMEIIIRMKSRGIGRVKYAPVKTPVASAIAGRRKGIL